MNSDLSFPTTTPYLCINPSHYGQTRTQNRDFQFHAVAAATGVVYCAFRQEGGTASGEGGHGRGIYGGRAVSRLDRPNEAHCDRNPRREQGLRPGGQGIDRRRVQSGHAQPRRPVHPWRACGVRLGRPGREPLPPQQPDPLPVSILRRAAGNVPRPRAGAERQPVPDGRTQRRSLQPHRHFLPRAGIR